jgi:hypothetical protein
LIVRRRGYQSWEHDLDVAPGDRLQLRSDLIPTARRRAARWTLLAGGLVAAGAIASGIVWGAEYAKASAFNNRPGERTSNEIDAYNRRVATIDQARIWTSIGIALGGSLLITTITLYWWD